MDIHNKSLAAILNNLPDAFMIMNENGKVEFLNTVAQKITGYTNSEARKMRCDQLFNSSACNTDCLFRCDTGKNKVSYKRELLITRKDGRQILVECTTSTIIDTDGTVAGAVEVFKDISKIKLLEGNLKDYEYKYRRLFESTKDMIFITSRDGRFVDFNQSLVDLLGYKSKRQLYALEFLKEIFIDIIHWQVFQKQIDLNGYVKDFEAGLKTKDGSRLHCSLSANAIKDSKGEIVGYEGIANINLLKEVKQLREKLKKVTAKLFQSREIECKRISRELHDETGSALTGINLKLDAVQNKMPVDAHDAKSLLHHIKGQVNDTYMGIRRISHRLHPALLSDLGLEPALDQYISEISERTNLNIIFKMIGFTGRINPEIETVLYRLSQEALTNTLKYASAKTFKLSLIKGYPSIIFVASDDGIGFDFENNQQEKSGLGLLSMRERTTMLGGRFGLRSAPGQGTQIRIEIPINNDDALSKEYSINDLQEVYE